jgi:hypothetical protein
MSFEDSAEENQQFMPENRQRINITGEVFKYMLEMRDHLIPDISREMIQDKSKSDRLAKLLTCWQAGYFCLQCVYRLSQQLSITLLELNVFAHVLCAALFVIWSDKPRDVCEPTLIIGEEALDVCATFCLGYEIMSFPAYPEKALDIVRPTSFHCWQSDRDNLFYGVLHDHTIKVLETHWNLRLSHGYQKDFFTQVTINARDLRRLQRVSKLVQREISRSLGPRRIVPAEMPDPMKGRSLARTTNWCMNTGDATKVMIGTSLTGDRHHRLHWLRFVTGLTFTGTCYGGLHLAAWKTPFASRAEAILWRAASVSIMAPGPSCVLVACLKFICYKIASCYRDSSTLATESPRTDASSATEHPQSGPSGIESYVTVDSVAMDAIAVDSVAADSGTSDYGTADYGTADSSTVDSRTDYSVARRRTSTSLRHCVSWSMALMAISWFYFSVLWYIFCRVFIIVESFIMLAHIPDQALQVPTWSAYIPHIV